LHGERADRHLKEIAAVTHRRDAIFHTIVGGGPEHLLPGANPGEAMLLTRRAAVVPQCTRRAFRPRRHLPLSPLCADPEVPEGRGQEHHALRHSPDITAARHVTVVDEDVDIHNSDEAEWAVATRFQADRDLVIIPESQGSKPNPSTRNGVGAKMGLDATKSRTVPEMTFKRIRVQGEEKVDVVALLASGNSNWRDALKA
jgi:2,5-furandicarboxylate decarboxylase 1